MTTLQNNSPCVANASALSIDGDASLHKRVLSASSAARCVKPLVGDNVLSTHEFRLCTVPGGWWAVTVYGILALRQGRLRGTAEEALAALWHPAIWAGTSSPATSCRFVYRFPSPLVRAASAISLSMPGR